MLGEHTKDCKDRPELLSTRCSHSLATNPWSRLVATFALTASNAEGASAKVRTFEYATARSQELYGHTAVWPPGPRFQTGATQLDEFLAGSGIGYDLASAYEHPPRWNDLTLMQPEIESTESMFTTALTRRTWLVSADDFPTYTLKGYDRALENLRTLKVGWMLHA